jgi:hypothetical protein
MKKTSDKEEDLRSEYKFDYTKAKPNRFAGRMADRTVVVLDPDVAEVFTTPDSVNEALRALISAMPKDRYLKTKRTGLAVKEK